MGSSLVSAPPDWPMVDPFYVPATNGKYCNMRDYQDRTHSNFEGIWKPFLLVAFIVLIIAAALDSPPSEASQAFRILPDTSNGIHLYASRYTDIIPSDNFENSPVDKFDLMVGPFPDISMPTDQPNTVELVQSKNPDLAALMYLHMGGEPAVGAGIALPWGADPDRSRLPHWREINTIEEAFFHAADPAGLTLVPGDGEVQLYWSTDRRDVVSGISIRGYNVYRSASPNGPYQKLNSDSLPSTSFVDIDVINDQTYYYQVNSTTAEEEYSFSWAAESTPIASPPSLVPYGLGFAVSAENSNDNFHPLPGSRADYSFWISVQGSPTKVRLNFNGEWHEMSPTSEGYEVTVPSILIDDDSGFTFFVQAENGRESFRTPDEGVFTTNINNRVRCRWWGTYLTNPNNRDYQEMVARWIAEWTATYSYDGAFFDLATVYSPIENGAEAKPIEYDRADFIAGKKSMLRYVREQIAPSMLLYNAHYERDADYSGLTDGAMLENFAYRVDRTYQSNRVWRDQINFMIESDLAHNEAVIALAKWIDEEDSSVRMYALASYLLGKGRKSYYCSWPAGCYFTLAEYFLQIGSPIQTFSSIDDYYSAEQRVYRRDFTSGIVLVNPSASETSEEIILPRTYYRAEPVGGRLETTGGSIEFTPVISLVLPPHTGAVLLVETENSATPSATPTVTFTPTLIATVMPSLTPGPPEPSATAERPTSTLEPTSTSQIPTPEPTVMEGDLSGDGAVNVLDVQLCVNVFLGTELDPAVISRSDVNGDGKVDVLDVQALANVALAR